MALFHSQTRRHMINSKNGLPYIPATSFGNIIFFMFGLSAILSYDKIALLYRIRQNSNRAALYSCIRGKPSTTKQMMLPVTILDTNVGHTLAVKPKQATLKAPLTEPLCPFVKALSHYNVLANVCRRMKYISSTLAYAEIL